MAIRPGMAQLIKASCQEPPRLLRSGWVNAAAAAAPEHKPIVNRPIMAGAQGPKSRLINPGSNTLHRAIPAPAVMVPKNNNSHQWLPRSKVPLVIRKRATNNARSKPIRRASAGAGIAKTPRHSTGSVVSKLAWCVLKPVCVIISFNTTDRLLKIKRRLMEIKNVANASNIRALVGFDVAVIGKTIGRNRAGREEIFCHNYELSEIACC